MPPDSKWAVTISEVLSEFIKEKRMDLDEYMQKVGTTAIHPLTMPEDAHPHMAGLLYCATKLCGEAGEVSEVIGKALRDDDGQFPRHRTEQLMYEMGDVFWYLMRICQLLDVNPHDVLRINVDKLERRKAEGKLHGDGSDR